MAAEGIHAIEPLPHPAKLSGNLYAMLDSLDQRGEAPLEETKPPESQLRHVGKAAKKNVSDPRYFSPLENRFNHGEGLPTDLVISLTPGAWKPRLVRAWRQHLTSFVSTRSLWDEHLRELFLWTRSTPEKFVANGAGRRQGGLSAGHNISDEAKSNNSGLIAAHGLGGTTSLWEQEAVRSSEDGACDLGRLGAFLENDRSAPLCRVSAVIFTESSKTPKITRPILTATGSCLFPQICRPTQAVRRDQLTIVRVHFVADVMTRPNSSLSPTRTVCDEIFWRRASPKE